MNEFLMQSEAKDVLDAKRELVWGQKKENKITKNTHPAPVFEYMDIVCSNPFR